MEYNQNKQRRFRERHPILYNALFAVGLVIPTLVMVGGMYSLHNFTGNTSRVKEGDLAPAVTQSVMVTNVSTNYSPTKTGDQTSEGGN